MTSVTNDNEPNNNDDENGPRPPSNDNRHPYATAAAALVGMGFTWSTTKEGTAWWRNVRSRLEEIGQGVL